MRNGRTLVLVEKSGHCIAFHHLERTGAAERIHLASYPHEMVADREGRFAFVGHYGVQKGTDAGVGGHEVFVIDIARRRLVNTLDCRPYTRIHGLAVDEAGRLYALSEAADVLLVFDNPCEDRLPSRGAATGGLKSHLLSVTRDGGIAYVTNLLTHTVTRIAPRDPTIAPRALLPGVQPEGNCLGSDETVLFVANRGSNTIARIDVRDFVVDSTAPVLADPTRIYCVGSDRLLVTHFRDQAVSLLDRASLREIAHLRLEGRPAAACVDPGRGSVHVSLDSNESLEIDLETMRIVARRLTGAEPDACFISGSPA